MGGFFQAFEQAARRFPQRCAIEVQRVDGLDLVDYATLESMASSAAAFLARHGARRGERWAILAENSIGWCAVYLGMSRLGLVAVPLDTNYGPAQVSKLLLNCDASGLVVSATSAEIAQQALAAGATVPTFALEQNDATFPLVEFQGPAHSDAPIESDPTDSALILYTSGTTHDPKGVVLTHGNLIHVCDGARKAIGFTHDDAVLSVLPLFHALAQVANLALPFSLGARAVFIETVNTTELLRALQERGISIFCCVPQFFYLVHERVAQRVSSTGRIVRALFSIELALNGWLRDTFGINLGPRLFGRVHAVMGSQMRALVTGGSRFDPAIGRELYRLGFDILQAYGLTETTGGVSVLRSGDRHVASVGQPLEGLEVKILPAGKDVPVQEPPRSDRVRGNPATPIGEVAVRGPVVTPGYYERPDANAATFAEGWLKTGDLGYLDDQNRLYITGRAKEMIVTSSGKNIYPEEVEANYLSASAIAELCVLGYARPGEPAAERLHAIIVPDFDELRRRKITNSRELIRYEIEEYSAKLPSHKRILSYTIVPDPLPRTTTRKLKRLEIERRFLAGEFDQAVDPVATQTSDDAAWLQDPHVEEALALIRSAVREPDGVRGSANLELDLGLDSMERVELLASVESCFGVRLEDEIAQQLFTVRDVVEATRPQEGSAGERAQIEDAWPTLLARSEPDDPDVASFFKSKLAALSLFVTLKVLYLFSWVFAGFRVRGRENLPKEGPYLICPNHQSYVDGFLLAAALPFRVQRHVFIVGDSEYFQSPISAWFARMVRLIPVDPDANLLRAMRVGAVGLRDRRVLMLFPEGERSIDGEIKRFKKGAAILSTNVAAPIIPIAIDGAQRLWPRAGRLRLSRLIPFVGKVELSIGAPLVFDTPDQGTPDYQARTMDLRGAVERLLQKLRD